MRKDNSSLSLLHLTNSILRSENYQDGKLSVREVGCVELQDEVVCGKHLFNSSTIITHTSL